MKFFGVFVVLCLVVYSTTGKSLPTKAVETATAAETEADSEPTTPLPWLRFLKNKKSTTVHSTTETAETTVAPALIKVKGKNPLIGSLPRPASVTRAIGSAPGPQTPAVSSSAINDLLNDLIAYFQVQPSGSVEAQDRTSNPDTLYDLGYLDWVKKRQAVAEPEQFAGFGATPPPPFESDDPAVAASNPALVAPPQPQPQPFMYPMAYSPFFPLASLKMQKAMANAQLAAMFNITTTPKPMKLKLKIQIPGTVDLTQMGMITSGISGSLPPGSIVELD